MSDGAGVQGYTDGELRSWRSWRDKVEAQLGAHEVHINHGQREHDRHREAIKDLRDSMERQFEQFRAAMAADNERAQANVKLSMNERLAQHERVVLDRIDGLQDEVREHVPAPAAPAQLPLKWIGLGVVMMSLMMISVGIVIGLGMKLDTVVELAKGAVTP